MKVKSPVKLLRALGLSALTFYGLGDILGAGIYALIGKIAGQAGHLTWLSFVVAVLLVLPTALTYAELASRFPKSGGVSIYVYKAFGRHVLSLFAGLLLFAATVLSIAALSHAFVGYFLTLGFIIPNWLGVLGLLSVLFLINLRGIKQSSLANIISTLVEISGLFIVLACGIWYLTKNDPILPSPLENPIGAKEIFQGAALAFYAFTGFEDLVNVAEEVKQPEKNIPRALLTAIGLAACMYLSVSWVATAIIPSNELAQSGAPLIEVVKKSYTAFPAFVFSIIAMFAVFNTSLLNFITASRLIYGMSKIRLLPKFLQKVHYKFHTPYMAILLVFPLILAVGMTGSLLSLVSSASVVVLLVFSFSACALITIKFKEKKAEMKPLQKDIKIFQVPLIVPILALPCNLSLMAFLPLANLMHALIFVLVAGFMAWAFINK